MDENHDARLMTTEWGRGDASNVALLVHGLTGRAGAFETLVEGLAPEGSVPGGGWRFLADAGQRGGLLHGLRGRSPRARAASRSTRGTCWRSWTGRGWRVSSSSGTLWGP